MYIIILYSQAQQVATVAAKGISELRNVSSAEVEIAKQTLKARITLEHTTSWKRLEDRTKALFYSGSAQVDFVEAINKITVQDVKTAVSQAIKTPLTLVAQGG